MKRYRLDDTAIHDLADFIAAGLHEAVSVIEQLILDYLKEESG